VHHGQNTTYPLLVSPPPFLSILYTILNLKELFTNSFVKYGFIALLLTLTDITRAMLITDSLEQNPNSDVDRRSANQYIPRF
jgi:uncharacterized membrane protein